MVKPVIIHIPHASTDIPDHEREKLPIHDGELRRELLRMTDRYADELSDLGAQATRLIYPVSRLVVDPERFADDDKEPMSGKGMGAIYTSTSHGRLLRADVSDGERQRLLQTYYFPHHAEFTRLVQNALDDCGRCLIIDAHSFPSSPLPCDLNQDADRPDICIGTDSFHTPRPLEQMAVGAFEGIGWRVKVNEPYAGTIVPERFLGVDSRVGSIMVEVNRALYMDENTGDKLPQFQTTARNVQAALGALTTSSAGA